MECDDFLPFLDVYIDGELDDKDVGEAEAHLRECESCRSRVKLRVQVKEQVKECCCDDSAPDALKNKIQSQIPSHQKSSDWLPVGKSSQWLGYAFLGAPIAASVVFSIYFLFPQLSVAPATSEQRPIAEQSVNWHQGNLPLDVASQNPDKVADWFRGKTEFPVRLPPFEGQSVAIQGGRLANIQHHRAALVKYDIDGIRMSVMIFNGDRIEIPRQEMHSIGQHAIVTVQANDYEVAILQDGGLTYTITSKLSEKRLLDLISKTLGQPS